jgi:HrpA-like RNA helicase
MCGLFKQATDILFALLKQIQRRRKRVLAARKERNEALHRGKGFLSPKQQAAAAAASAKSPKLAAALAAAAATKSPRPSSAAAAARSPSAAAAPSSATAAAADAATCAGDPSPGMHPLCLLSDETHPQPRPTSKEARKERKKRKREEAEKREAAIAAAAAAAAAAAPAVSPAAAPATPAVAAASSFALDDENAPIDLTQVPNLDNLQELKLVVMSATLAAKDFSSYFGSAPVLSIAGRTHPVELLYAEEAQVDYLDAVLVAVMQIHVDAGDKAGDIVFLTGAEEIEAARRSIEEKARKLRPQQQQQQQQDGEEAGPLLDLHVCAIYASLPPEVQLQVFAPARPGSRKVILATNIAETSLTIPGVRFVVDSGVTKMRLYDANRGSDMLRVVEISQAEATQRAGRAGRDAPGEAYRLYTEEDFKKLKPHLLPEILRSNLASVVLQLKALRVRNVLNFDFMTRPSRAALTRALEELYALRALGYNGDLSALGSQMVHFPLPPHYAKIAIMSSGEDLACSVEALKILAMMSVENVFFVPSKSAAESAGATMNNNSNSSSSTTTGAELSSGKQSALAAYAQAKRQFAHVDGDHFTYLDVFNAFVLVQSGGGGATTTNAHTSNNSSATSAVRRTQEWCRTHFLNYRNLLKAQQVYAQLVALMERLDLPLVSSNAAATGRETDPVAHTDPIKKALLLGLYSRVARKQAHDASYVTLSDGQTVYIHPSSVLLVRSTKARPELVVYTELVHTSRAYMRDCMELPDLRWLAESNNNNSTDETSAVGATTTSVVRGGKQQAELHARLAGINTSGSKLSGSGLIVASSSATAASATTGGPALTLAQQAAAVGLTKKQLKRQLKAAAAPPERAAPHASAMQIDEQQRPPREKKKKPAKDGRGSALLDFVNSL